MSYVVRTAALALLCAAAAAVPANARTNSRLASYDGPWSVLIVTEQGACDRAYRYGIQISDGRVIYDGAVARMTGQVLPSGAVRVSVSAGSAYANASGRLAGSSGRGNWRGSSGSTACSGYWTATRGGGR